MRPTGSSLDRTNFMQSLMHMIKGNFGTGILAMPASFNHCGLINAIIGLPLLAIIATYCVHLLVRSSQHLENKVKSCSNTLEYSELAKSAFVTGPRWARPLSGFMCLMIDLVLITCQLGICCVYLVFIVDNTSAVLGNFGVHIKTSHMFLIIVPIALLLSYIRTLKRLAIASACANFLQCIGIGIIIEFLLQHETSSTFEIVNFKPFSEVALGFGSAMFAFEGICVVMPIYSRMKRQEQMGGLCGVINLSYFILLCLYMIIGLFGYLRFGPAAAGSITLNLPKKPQYEMVRAMFATSLFLSYPLQFYVLNETIWNWISDNFLLPRPSPAIMSNNNSVLASSSKSNDANNNIGTITTFTKQQQQQSLSSSEPEDHDVLGKYSKYEYCCRTVLVLFTFVLAASVPKLSLMMDFFGSISGTSLSITLPPLIHLVALWEDTSGKSRWVMAFLDGSLIIFGLLASANGSYFSLMEIIKSFNVDPLLAVGANSHH